MKKRIPVYEQELTLGDHTVTILTTVAPRRWQTYDYWEEEEPFGYLELHSDDTIEEATDFPSEHPTLRELGQV